MTASTSWPILRSTATAGTARKAAVFYGSFGARPKCSAFARDETPSKGAFIFGPPILPFGPALCALPLENCGPPANFAPSLNRFAAPLLPLPRRPILDHKQENILAIPKLDLRLRPNFLADQVQHPVALFFEEILPKPRPLFVDVMGAALQRHRRGEKHHRRQPRQRLDKAGSRMLREVLRHFQAYRQIENLRHLKRLAQI